MDYYIVTISNEYEAYNKSLINLIRISGGVFTTVNTKDGTVYEISFKAIGQMDKFKEALNKEFPFIK